MFNNINNSYNNFADIKNTKFAKNKENTLQSEDDFNLSIGDVSKILSIPQHTLRFWTGEFENYIEYRLGNGSRRYYSKGSIEVFNKINKLIHKDGLKIKAIKERNLIQNKQITNFNDFTINNNNNQNQKIATKYNYDDFKFVNTKQPQNQQNRTDNHKKTNVIGFSSFSNLGKNNKSLALREELENIKQDLQSILNSITD